jgi:HK97 family phage prohead protease
MRRSDTVDEIRTYQVELREVQAVGRPFRYLEGRAVPYNTWQDVGPFMEMHAEGSFARSTRVGTGQGLPLLIGHDHSDLDNLVGHAEKWRHDPTGMYGVWRLNDSPKAQQAARLAESGDLTGLSVGFQEIHRDYVRQPRDIDIARGREHKDWVVRTESRLMEVSLTPVPAFADAEVICVRSVYDPDRRQVHPIPTPDLDIWRAKLAALQR